MSIIRTATRRQFTVIPNAIFNDKTLSIEALALLTFLLSRPPSWEVRTVYLKTRFNVGLNKVRDLLKELMVAGYIRRETKTNGNLKNGFEYIIHDRVQTDPETTVFETTDSVASDSVVPTKDLEGTKTERLVREKGKNPTDSHPKRNCQAMVEIYHEHCPSLPPVVEMTATRRRIALARLKDLGGLLSSWEAYCDHVEASDWLTGRSTRGSNWRADWDWITAKTNYLRIMEGRYADRKKASSGDDYEALARKVLDPAEFDEATSGSDR